MGEQHSNADAHPDPDTDTIALRQSIVVFRAERFARGVSFRDVCLPTPIAVGHRDADADADADCFAKPERISSR